MTNAPASVAAAGWSKISQALQNDNAEAAATMLRGLIAQDEQARFSVRVVKKALMDPARYHAGIPYIGELRDVLVDTDYWNVIDGDRVYNREPYDRQLANAWICNRRMTARSEEYVVALPPPLLEIPGTSVLLGSDYNYSHWLYRSVPKFMLIERSEEARTARLLVAEKRHKFHQEYLALLGVDEARLLALPQPCIVRVERLLVPTSYRYHPKFSEAVEWLRSRLGAPVGNPQRRLLITRRDADARRLQNIDELEAALEPFGFESISLGSLSIRQQIDLFNNAHIIVAEHGASLTNLLFAGPDTRVVEICHTAIANMREFEWMSQQLGQRMVTVVSDSVVKHMHDDFSIDVNKVLAALTRIAGDLLESAHPARLR